MNIAIKKVFQQNDIYRCIVIRSVVFVAEQDVSIPEEIDDKDSESIHYLLTVDEAPAGTARVRYVDHKVKIERVAILKEYRGKDLGKQLMEYILQDIKKENQVRTAMLGAQSYALAFYERLGFQPFGEEYMDAGIPHRDMTLKW